MTFSLKILVNLYLLNTFIIRNFSKIKIMCNKKIIFIKTLLLAPLLYVTSCAPTHYIYNPLIIADVEEKGDYNVTGSVAISMDNINYHLNANIAVTDHLIFQSSVTNLSDNSKTYNYDTKGNYYDFSIGYTNNNTNNDFYIESFVGYGLGNLKNIGIEDSSRYANFKYNKFFSQVSLNYKVNQLYFHIPIRIAYADYTTINHGTFLNNTEGKMLNYFKENPSKWMLSIGKTISIKVDQFKFNAFASYHSPTQIEELITFNNVYVGLGVTYFNSTKK